MDLEFKTSGETFKVIKDDNLTTIQHKEEEVKEDNDLPLGAL